MTDVQTVLSLIVFSSKTDSKICLQGSLVRLVKYAKALLLRSLPSVSEKSAVFKVFRFAWTKIKGVRNKKRRQTLCHFSWLWIACLRPAFRVDKLFLVIMQQKKKLQSLELFSVTKEHVNLLFILFHCGPQRSVSLYYVAMSTLKYVYL